MATKTSVIVKYNRRNYLRPHQARVVLAWAHLKALRTRRLLINPNAKYRLGIDTLAEVIEIIVCDVCEHAITVIHMVFYAYAINRVLLNI